MGNYRTIIQRLTTLLIAICLLGIAESMAVGINPKDLKNLQRKVQAARESTEKKENVKKLWKQIGQEIEGALSKDANNPELNYLYGVYFYYGMGDVKTARYRYTRAIQASEHHYKARSEMIRVEERLKNYSSAICYINELLEYQPYDKELWQKKINLLRLGGNEAEADAVNERMAHIFSNDKDIVRQYKNRWNTILKKSELEAQAGSLEQEIGEVKGAAPFSKYQELTELYTALGEYDKAIETAKRGLTRANPKLTAPQREELTKKVIGLLMNDGRYSQAEEFATDKHNTYKPAKGAIESVRKAIAEDARLHDAYEANARLYEKTHNHDALVYLTNTSISRGYYDDALGYIELLHGKGSTESLKKQYGLEIRMGHQQAAQNVLMKLYRQVPNDTDLQEEYINAFHQLSNSDVANGQWRDAERDLQELYNLLKGSTENEYWPSMMTQRITTYGHLGQYATVDDIHQDAVNTDPKHRGQYDSAYEDLMVRRIRGYIEEERPDSALDVAKKLLGRVPDSGTALRNCINLSQTLNDSTLFYKMAQQGYDKYKPDPYFVNKYAIALQQQHNYRRAIDTLDVHMPVTGHANPALISTYSGITHTWATQQMDSLQRLSPKTKYDKAVSIRKDYEHVIQCIEKALKRDSLNKELLLDRAVAHERIHLWDSAFIYQQRYWNPSVAEQREFYHHTDYLQYRSFRERVDFSYTHALYDTRDGNLASTGHLYSIATIAYSHLGKADTYTGQISYKGIDGYHDASEHEAGGAGVELMAQWEHQFSDRWSGMVNASYSNRYFNKWGYNISTSYTLPHDWTPSLRIGYRRTPETYLYMSSSNSSARANEQLNLLLIAPSVLKAWDFAQTTLNADMAVVKSSVYYNVGVKGKVFFNDDNVSSVSLTASFGTFPELTFFEQTALRNVSHTNSMIGVDAQFLCSSRLSIGFSGSWNTCYDPYWNTDGSLTDSYRNIYTLCAQLHVAF